MGRYRGSPNVFSYHASRSTDTSILGRSKPTFNKSSSRLSIFKMLPTILALGAIIYSLGYLLMLDSSPRIVILGDKDKANLLQDTEVYLKASQEILKGSVFNKTKLTINTETTAKKLKDRFPELKDVAITIPIASHKPVFELGPAVPAVVLASASAGPYVIDEQGRAVVKAQEVTSLEKLDLPKVNDESGLGLTLGKPVLPQEDIEFITSLYRQLKAHSLTVDSMILPTTPNELHLRLAGDRYLVKFDISGDARLQSGALMAVKAELSTKNISPAEYVDVRVRDKVFYK